MKYIQARPTEYLGVVFRSKSEALFAQALAWSGYPKWEYEPEDMNVEGYVPDFSLIDTRDYPHGFVDYRYAIEYKPRGVTDSYSSYLGHIADALKANKKCDRFFLVCGTPFDRRIGRKIWEWGTEWAPSTDLSFSWDSFDEALMRSRFDLA